MTLATILGVKADNHRVKAALTISQDKRNQEVFSLNPAIIFHLTHEILPTDNRYINKIATGNTCINVQAAAEVDQSNTGQGEDKLDNEESLGKVYNVNSEDNTNFLATV